MAATLIATAPTGSVAPSPDPADPPPARPAERIGLAALLAGTAIAYLWHITVNGMANNFYAGAAWAGAQNWKALLFGSLDPANFITVDKPPVSQWIMGLSGQLFGFSSASMLVPQALMAVGAVALLYAAVARATGSRGAGLLAGAVLAATPVAAMMFRYNHPDAVMVLLMTAAAYCTIRAAAHARGRWLVLAGVALGFAFLAKVLEGLMVAPALALTYLLVAPTSVRNRLWHLAGGAVALIVSSGWYVALTALWPASSRPYLAGSTDNTFLNTVLGYNGFGRFLGDTAPSGRIDLPEGYQAPPGLLQSFNDFGGPGAGRLFAGESGFEISWLIPAALLAFGLVIASRRGNPRTDPVRGAALTFGLWLVTMGAAFSVMGAIEHSYYTLALAPAVAGVLAIGVHELWRRREEAFGRLGTAALVAAMGGWAFVVLQRNSEWQPWVRWTIAGASAVVVLGLLGTALPATAAARTARRRVTAILVVVGVIAGLGGSTAYAAATLPQAHAGRSPVVGPAKPAETGIAALVRRQTQNFADGGAFTAPQIVAMLAGSSTTWSAAVDRGSVAAALELASHTPVIAIGGFADTDPVPTLEQFQGFVRDHELSYYLVQEMQLPATWRTGAHAPSTPTPPWQVTGKPEIADWVAHHYPATRIGNIAVYDLTAHPN
ncbi:phospholipid carrier-dependent glycosyltransferase [Nocardia brasiliensis]|uniref:Phospholipid carrier-dependent glycosyltransferase n=1 Tax=Nocardia brasiliensis TaxID=37326 RepID=A0A6G9XVR5_NOCBR|nr:glycosyltransferase family 39 protein [Nocardia brasiliensis]QIS05042.1 phospholipid carrier-dependent glycosyltransferase [Nocardia brasiliensis]